MAKSQKAKAVVIKYGVKSQYRQRLSQARKAYTQGTLATDDYIWTAMQCYAAEMKSRV